MDYRHDTSLFAITAALKMIFIAIKIKSMNIQYSSKCRFPLQALDGLYADRENNSLRFSLAFSQARTLQSLSGSIMSYI